MDFDAPDADPVDLVLGMMVPSEPSDDDYAEIKSVAAVLGDETLRERLRAAKSSSGLYEALVEDRRPVPPPTDEQAEES